ncbi:MAG TPA: endonuclease [Flavobacteriales bacterium]|nr:endonuclease [Flavobacteriales bacterium]
MLYLALLLTSSCEGQDKIVRDNKTYRIAFWNVENLFDIHNDTLTQDDEFTPQGEKQWNRYRYEDKLKKISKTIQAVGGWNGVQIIGFAEVENRLVLSDLTTKTGLASTSYSIVHKNSGDLRGIDVASIYDSTSVELLQTQFIEVKMPALERPTRDILHLNFSIEGRSLHVFYNHWPSRYGGKSRSEPKRIQAARTLRAVIDSLFNADSNANIIIMGDLNDHPEDRSVQDILLKKDTTELINLMSLLPKNEGTHQYRGEWAYLDQVIVSRSLRNGANGLNAVPGAYVFREDFLLEINEKYQNVQPNRTYLGPSYHGGFSDHLPIFIDLRLAE